MAQYIDYPLVMHENDPDVIREVKLIRYVLINTKTGELRPRNPQFKSESDAKVWQKEGEIIYRKERSVFCIVDKDNHRRSHWCESYGQCVDYSMAYPPDKRPDFGHDEYYFA